MIALIYYVGWALAWPCMARWFLRLPGARVAPGLMALITLIFAMFWPVLWVIPLFHHIGKGLEQWVGASDAA